VAWRRSPGATLTRNRSGWAERTCHSPFPARPSRRRATFSASQAHSISAGLDYPGVGPELAHLKDTGRLTLMQATDDEALEALQYLARTEGIIPALETAHAISAAREVARGLGPDGLVVVNVSGRGDKDVDQVRRALATRAATPRRAAATVARARATKPRAKAAARAKGGAR